MQIKYIKFKYLLFNIYLTLAVCFKLFSNFKEPIGLIAKTSAPSLIYMIGASHVVYPSVLNLAEFVVGCGCWLTGKLSDAFIFTRNFPFPLLHFIFCCELFSCVPQSPKINS